MKRKQTRLSLAPLTPEEALRIALNTPIPKPKKKQRGRRKRK